MFVHHPTKFPLIFSSCWLVICSVAAASDGLVINEILYQPDDEHASEFIEIYNNGSTPVDLGGWQIADAVTFTFPPQELAAGAYVVVAADPAALLAEDGVAALGPWAGKLSNDGERIILSDELGVEIDRVDYGTGFPWPTAAGGGGQSMELIHPSLDNDLGGSWRSAVPPGLLPERFLLPAAGTGWRWRPGASEASSPLDAWRESGFIEDETWSPAALPIGFGRVGDMTFRTSIRGMQGSYTSLFLRNEFTIGPGEIPPALQLRFMLDDGFALWINGVELHRENLPGEPGEELAISDRALGDYSESALVVESLAVSGYLVEGINTVSIQLFNSRAGSSDVGLDLQLISPASGVGQPALPTPGAENSVFAAAAAPQVRQVSHSPQQPSTGQDVLVTAKITDPQGVSGVNLEYQLVEPGSYIRRTDFEYDTRWTAIAMVDDGSGGDLVAGDSIFSVTVPGSLQEHRRLTRYRIVATDNTSSVVTVPYRDDPSANFAYFTYDGAPAWQGASIPGQTETLDFDAAQMNSLPIYQLISDADDVTDCQYDPAFNDDVYRWEGTLVYDGKVYDHIHYRIRDADSAYNTGKNKWKLRFNRGHYFQGRDDYGKAYKEKVRTLNWSALASPWNPANRGAAGLDEALAFRFWERAGIVSRNANYFHLRIIDGAAEQDSTDQFDGDNWGLYLAIDHADRRFLDERGLPDGNTFNMHFNASSSINEAAGQPQDRSDLFAFTGTGDGGYNRDPVQPASWWEANVELDSYFSYRSVVEAVNHSDLRDRENSNLYRNPVTGKWTVIPWDVDLLYEEFDRWGPSGVQTTAPLEQFRKSLTHPELNIRFQNRARELRDLLLNDDQGWTLVDELVATLGGTGGATGWAELDAARWNQDPRSTKIEGSGGNEGMLFYMNPYTSTRFPQHSRTLNSADFPGMVDWIKDFIAPSGFGGDRLATMSDNVRIPATPTIDYTGTAAFPTNGLSFACSDFTAGSGSSDFAAMEWRIGEIYNPDSAGYVAGEPWRYEVDSFWASGVLDTFSNSFTVPPIAAREGGHYRARVRHQGTDGRWSHWSEPVDFVASAPDLSAYLDGLVISEVMYKPGGGAALEFIEIKNVGSVTLDLSDVRFTKGIDFDFAGSVITSIAPGEYVLVVEDLAAFEATYGGALLVAGEYQFSTSNGLSNGGERLKLSFGAGSTIRDFVYDDELPWPTAPDVSGYSLVLIDPESLPDHSVASNWRSSTAPGGNPGSSDAALPFSGVAGADDDNDGLVALLEHALGGDDGDPASAAYPKVSVEPLEVGNAIDDYLLIRIQRDLAAEDLIISAEISSDLINWESGPTAVILVDETANGDGTSTLTYRTTQAVDSESQIYIRARAGQRR
ncbi:MAG: hypothetical protein ACI9NC_002808 [Verrucomicrobiales bacterium]|jgi:hypothetical protein